MGLEIGTYVNDLISTNPVGATDDVNQGDNHLRLIKSVLKATFPNASRAFRFETVLTKTSAYSVVAADERALVLADATSAAFTITLPAGSAVFAGFSVTVTKSDTSANIVTVDGNGAETVNGEATRSLSTQFQTETYMWDGTGWKVLAETATQKVPIYDTLTTAAAATIAAAIKRVEVLGYSAVISDKGRAIYERVDAEPTHALKFRSVDRFLSTGVTDGVNGGWWAILPDQIGVRLEQCGAGATGLTNLLGYINANPTITGWIIEDATINAWTGFQITGTVRLRGKGRLTFTSPTANDVFTVSTAVDVIDVESVKWTLTTTPSRLNLFDLGGLTSGTMAQFRMVNCEVSGGGFMVDLDTPATITDIEVRGNTINGSENGFSFDCLIGFALATGNKLLSVVNSVDERMHGLRFGKDAAAGQTNQTSSSFFHVHNNKVDTIQSTSVAMTSNGVNAIEVYGEDVLVESNTVHNVISTKTTDVEGIYAKARRGRISFNVMKNAGTNQGSITCKGEHPDSNTGTSPLGEWMVIEGNNIDGGEFGIYYSTPDTVVRGNIIKGTSNRAVWGQHNAKGLGEATVSGNKVSACGGGILVEGSFTSLKMDDNEFFGLTRTTGDLAAIYLDFSSASLVSGRARISSTVVDGVTTQTSDKAQGVLIEGGTNMPELVQIDGIDLANIDDHPIRIGGTVAGAKVVIRNAMADKPFGEINSGTARMATFRFQGTCQWAEASNVSHDLLVFFITDDNAFKSTAHITVEDGASDWAVFDLEAFYSKTGGNVSTIVADVDTEFLSAGAPVWDGSIITRTNSAHQGKALNFRSNNATPTLEIRAELEAWA